MTLETFGEIFQVSPIIWKNLTTKIFSDLLEMPRSIMLIGRSIHNKHILAPINFDDTWRLLITSKRISYVIRRETFHSQRLRVTRKVWRKWLCDILLPSQCHVTDHHITFHLLTFLVSSTFSHHCNLFFSSCHGQIMTMKYQTGNGDWKGKKNIGVFLTC